MPRRSTKDVGRLSVVACSVQPGAERFSENEVPAVAHGRNNLTAISTELDLYFIAENGDINVYKPCFPDQRLSDLLCKWSLPVTAAGLQGYINPRCPHAVNAILIDKLGNEEILVCACDDGDVILYYTRPIQNILNASRKRPLLDVRLRPLLMHNLGKSAWGLAVHRNARLLAVSCNTHCIQVFAFALTDDSILYNDPDAEYQYPGRFKDYSIELEGHNENIPNIAFFNSDLDKEGRFLVSTDLSGKIIFWDLRERRAMKVIDPSMVSSTTSQTKGWSIACLDPRSFLLVATTAEMYGQNPQIHKTGVYDITQPHNIQDTLMWHPTSWDESREQDLHHGTTATLLRQLAAAQDHLDDLREDINRSRQRDAAEAVISNSAMDADSEEFSQAWNLPNLASDYDEDELDTIMDTMDESDFGHALNSIGRTEQRYSPASQSDSDEFGNGPSGVTIARTVSGSRVAPQHNRIPSSAMRHSENAGWPTTAATDRASRTSVNLRSLPILDQSKVPFLLFHTGQDSVSLLQAPFEKPTIISRTPCYQRLLGPFAWLENLDRLHLTQAIPDLNLLITATATGRAAVYTTTRRILTHTVRPVEEYGLRLDYLLPFFTQQQNQERPAAALIGIAAAPVQGFERRTTKAMFEQRWRLLLTYADQTVLSYELWRTGDPSFAPDLI